MKSQKRAMTAVVATVILVALVIIAIGIVSVVIFNIVGNSADDAASNAKCLGTIVKIESATSDDTNYIVKVSRVSGSEEITGVLVTLGNSTASYMNHQAGKLISGAGDMTITVPKTSIVDATKVKAQAYFNGTQVTYCSATEDKTLA